MLFGLQELVVLSHNGSFRLWKGDLFVFGTMNKCSFLKILCTFLSAQCSSGMLIKRLKPNLAAVNLVQQIDTHTDRFQCGDSALDLLLLNWPSFFPFKKEPPAAIQWTLLYSVLWGVAKNSTICESEVFWSLALQSDLLNRKRKWGGKVQNWEHKNVFLSW